MTTTEAPPIEGMKRADLPTIWNSFFADVSALKQTAETLTVTDAGDVHKIKLARQTRLELRQIRLAIEARRKEMTEFHLKTKQEIDKSAKWLKDLIEPLEARLEDQEKFVERQEATRKEALRVERVGLLSPFADCTPYPLADMPEDAFTAPLESSKFAFEQRQRAEAEATQERARVFQENERLRAEAVLKDQTAAAERAKAAAAERALAAARAELRRQVDASAAAVRRDEAEKAEAERKAAAAPDREKLQAFILEMTVYHGERTPTMHTQAGLILWDKISRELDAVLAEAAQWANEL